MRSRAVYNFLSASAIIGKTFIKNEKNCASTYKRVWLSTNHACVGKRYIYGGKFTYKVEDIVTEWAKLFTEAEIDEPKSSIEHIVAHALNSRKVSDVYRYKNKLLSPEQFDKVVKLCKMRLNKMPVQYILGEWDFRNLTLKMEPPVFIPRPESEMLVEIVSKEIQDKDNVLELGCGTGAISLALLSCHLDLKITAVDKSAKACDLTKFNAKLHNLHSRIKIIEKEMREDNVNNFLDETFDVIISNPPYVPSEQMINIQPEIELYEDLDALDGGKDGLKIIKLVLRISSQLLNKNGKVFLEVDTSHPEPVKAWLRQNYHLRLSLIKVHKDFMQYDRFLEIVKENCRNT